MKKRTSDRLLILDVDNTLLHVPVYDPLIHALAGNNTISEKDFYRTLPDGGITIESGKPHKVYPRPHLIEFLEKAKKLGYDLALCSTATHDYLYTVLPLCGIDTGQFVAILSRQSLKYRGQNRVKDVTQFLLLGYPKENIVAVDDRNDAYTEEDHVLVIPPFYATHQNFQEDIELLIVIEKLTYLGDRQLSDARYQRDMERGREDTLFNLFNAAFDSKKYKSLSFRPQFFARRVGDIDNFPTRTGLESILLDNFLIYKNFGLVGTVERQGHNLLINNYCPDTWTDQPSGISEIKYDVIEIKALFGYFETAHLVGKCEYLGYQVAEHDLLTLVAVTLESSHFGGFNILALRTGLLENEFMS